MTKVLIAIVDDDEALRLSTCLLLKRAGFDVRLFKSGDDFLAAGVVPTISCVLLDLHMPGCDGFAVLTELQARAEGPPVLVVTGHGNIPLAVEAMKRGAHDFIEKPYKPSVLMAAIESSLLREATAVSMGGIDPKAVLLVESLSDRHRAVLQGILNGQQNKVIAYNLRLSIRTVEAYRTELLSRLGARGIAQAVRIALGAGMESQTPVTVNARGRQPGLLMLCLLALASIAPGGLEEDEQDEAGRRAERRHGATQASGNRYSSLAPHRREMLGITSRATRGRHPARKPETGNAGLGFAGAMRAIG